MYRVAVEIPEDALGAQNGSATRGTGLPQLPDPAGHRQGEAASLLGQSESQPRNGIGEKFQDGAAMAVTHRKSLRRYLGRRQTDAPVTSDIPLLLACPHGCVGYNGICYFFSRDRLSWDQAQTQCSELGASLAVLKDKEMEFLFRHSGNVDYWLGLHRQDQRLQWVDGSSFSSSVPVLGNAPCLHLAGNYLGGQPCSNDMQYICSRAQSHL